MALLYQSASAERDRAIADRLQGASRPPPMDTVGGKATVQLRTSRPSDRRRLAQNGTQLRGGNLRSTPLNWKDTELGAAVSVVCQFSTRLCCLVEAVYRYSGVVSRQHGPPFQPTVMSRAQEPSGLPGRR